MASVFKKTIIRYVDSEGRRASKGTPGARKVKEQSPKWYGYLPGTRKAVPLSKNKSLAAVMLAQLRRKADLESVGLDPDIARVLDAWPTLSLSIRAAVVALIDAASTTASKQSPSS